MQPFNRCLHSAFYGEKKKETMIAQGGDRHENKEMQLGMVCYSPWHRKESDMT